MRMKLKELNEKRINNDYKGEVSDIDEYINTNKTKKSEYDVISECNDDDC